MEHLIKDIITKLNLPGVTFADARITYTDSKELLHEWLFEDYGSSKASQPWECGC